VCAPAASLALWCSLDQRQGKVDWRRPKGVGRRQPVKDIWELTALCESVGQGFAQTDFNRLPASTSLHMHYTAESGVGRISRYFL